MDTQSRCAKEIASGGSGYSSRRSSASDLPRHIPGKLASQESNRDLSRERRTSAGRQASGGTGHTSETRNKSVPSRTLSIKTIFDDMLFVLKKSLRKFY